MKIYMITLRWVASTINPPLVDAVLSEAGDWVRFNAETWLLSTERTPTDVRFLLAKHLTLQDEWLILPVDLYSPSDGWAPAWVWQWLQDRARVVVQQQNNALSLPTPGGIGNALTPR